MPQRSELDGPAPTAKSASHAELASAIEPVRGWQSWGAYVFTAVGLLAVQVALTEVGGIVAQRVHTSDRWWVHLTVGHITTTVATLALLWPLARWLHLDFGVRRGDTRAGLRALAVLAVVVAVVLTSFYLTLALGAGATRVDAPGDRTTLLPYFGFELLSGPTEELTFRALPIAVLAAIRTRPVAGVGSWVLTLETVVTTMLFMLAHVRYTLNPLHASADPWQLLSVAVLGTVCGVLYQRTRSVLWPMLLHSWWNVVVVAAATAVGFTG